MTCNGVARLRRLDPDPPLADGLAKSEIAGFEGFWQCQIRATRIDLVGVRVSAKGS